MLKHIKCVDKMRSQKYEVSIEQNKLMHPSFSGLMDFEAIRPERLGAAGE
jgi:hypothetical protein